jgi:hypothetical protein
VSLTCLIVSTILMMLLAGVVGGGVNCMQARKADDPVPTNKAYYFLLSIAAAFSVPLFLSVTKSELLESVLSTKLHAEDWFILFAMCLIAAIYAQSFLESVSKNLLQRVDNAVDTSHKALAKADDAQERSINMTADPAAQARSASAATAAASVRTTADPDTQKVLAALQNPKFPLHRRTLGGIVRDTKLDSDSAIAILGKLSATGVVRKVSGEISDTDYYELQAPPSAG